MDTKNQKISHKTTEGAELLIEEERTLPPHFVRCSSQRVGEG